MEERRRQERENFRGLIEAVAGKDEVEDKVTFNPRYSYLQGGKLKTSEENHRCGILRLGAVFV